MNDVIILMTVSILNSFPRWSKLILIVMHDWNVLNKLKNITLIVKLDFNPQHCSTVLQFSTPDKNRKIGKWRFFFIVN